MGTPQNGDIADISETDVLESLRLVYGLDGLAQALFDKPVGKAVAKKVMEESGLYRDGFTPEMFINTFMGYALFVIAGTQYIPQTAEEVFVMSDAQKFAERLVNEAGVDLGEINLEKLQYPSKPC